MSDAPHPATIVVTGVLGGLGCEVAHALLERGANVLGIDNLDPAAAPPPHQKYTLDRLSEHDGFHFLAEDIRAVEADDFRHDGRAPAALIQCAGVSPLRPGPTPEALVRELAGEAALELLARGRAAGIPLFLLPQQAPLSAGDPRADHPLWRALLDEEERIREQCRDHSDVQCLPLPALWGPGQALTTPPVAQVLQAISRVDVNLPADDSVVALASLQGAARLLADLSLLYDSNKRDNPSPLVPVHAARLSDLLTPLLERLNLTPESTTSSFAPWAPPTEPGVVEDPLALREGVEGLLAWLAALPHVPPADWPVVPKREAREKRARRRRAKKTRRRQDTTGEE